MVAPASGANKGVCLLNFIVNAIVTVYPVPESCHILKYFVVLYVCLWCV
jgi:hypothetical protein